MKPSGRQARLSESEATAMAIDLALKQGHEQGHLVGTKSRTLTGNDWEFVMVLFMFFPRFPGMFP